MRLRSTRRWRALAAVPCFAVVLAAPASASAACAGAGASPAQLGQAGVRHATLCLLNAQRRAHGVRALKSSRGLGKAALRHSKDMVAHRYFAHESRTGAPFSARLPRTGFRVLGENIGWGSGSLASPRAMVRSWMHSAAHRQNILDGRYKVIGIGVALGAPVAVSGGASYTTDFGG